jgi:hypothetical protein
MRSYFNCSYMARSKFLFLVMAAILDTGRRWRTQFWKGPLRDHPCQVSVNLVQLFQRRRFFKLLSQSQLSFAEMILRWSPFKIVSVAIWRNFYF